ERHPLPDEGIAVHQAPGHHVGRGGVPLRPAALALRVGQDAVHPLSFGMEIVELMRALDEHDEQQAGRHTQAEAADGEGAEDFALPDVAPGDFQVVL
ncbi:MAG: hypothetical protein H7A03_11160, partial [Pseudomonadales bacterium]|nr:hypothetical protein [Pseudomonadales bacterium]